MTSVLTPEKTEKIIAFARDTRAATGRVPGRRTLAREFAVSEYALRSLNLRDLLARTEKTQRRALLHSTPPLTVPLQRGPRRAGIRLTPPANQPPQQERPPEPGQPPGADNATAGEAPAADLPDESLPSKPAAAPEVTPEAAVEMPPEAQETTQEPPIAPILPVPERGVARWPLLFMAAPAGVAIWGGWVELGRMAGFGPVNLLPGLLDQVTLDLAITLPVGLEVYAAYAMLVWLGGSAQTPQARRFAAVSAVVSLVLGSAGQIAYHLMAAAGITRAPWPITAAVAVLPVAVLGMGTALAHLVHKPRRAPATPTVPLEAA
ncbi:hypothetical protein [Actinokineospora iranica]|uniref:Uncharacterized protein n=1 Tax=Actinokineospora iranica TaxID=1271860 RepID=A0A1G6VT79_9PSEU|nr:hypothetical protein [Actinokineospora iranica]SDD56036.1 hypothetical protein SAMN05216174_11350 [Actinokineospora iranica]